MKYTHLQLRETKNQRVEFNTKYTFSGMRGSVCYNQLAKSHQYVKYHPYYNVHNKKESQ